MNIAMQGLTVFLVIAGVLGTFLPVLPGTPLIVVGALITGLSTNFSVIRVRDLIILGLLSLLAEGVDYLFSLVGAKKFGASKAGLFGGMAGVFLGLLTMGPMGVLVGPFLGAAIAELLTGRRMDEAIRVGFGSIIGVLGGMLMTFLISLFMAGYVLMKIF